MLSQDDKKAIINQKISMLEAAVYSLEIDARVATITGDAEMLRASQEQLRRAIMQQQEYAKLLAEL